MAENPRPPTRSGRNSKPGSSTAEKGKMAEDLAASYLAERGYKIVERNFMCKTGEVDIIAEHEEYLVFVEVRSRHSRSTYDPVYSVDRRKQKRIVRAAVQFVGKRYVRAPFMRFDVVVVDLTPSVEITLWANAFEPEQNYWGL
jgi:putative endonuclease